MKILQGIGAALMQFVGSVLQIVVNSDGYISFNGKRLYLLTTAIAAGDGALAADGVSVPPAGSYGWTTHATGRRQFFISDGTYWQDYANQESLVFSIATLTTTGAVNAFSGAPFAGKLIAAFFIGTDALATSDTNYLTFTLTNLGQLGAGSTAMLAATDPNTTKATGGAALGANSKRTLTVHGTAANLAVAQGDRLRFTGTPTGTLDNTVTNGVIILVFQRTV